jgi:hypothetical protein
LVIAPPVFLVDDRLLFRFALLEFSVVDEHLASALPFRAVEAILGSHIPAGRICAFRGCRGVLNLH